MTWLILILFFIILLIFYNQWSWIHEFWEFKEIPGPHPLPFIGNMLQIILGKKSLGEMCMTWSRDFSDKPFVGYYDFMTPVLIINRLDYVETVLIKDFGHFIDRIPQKSKNLNLSERFLFFMTGSTWATLRSKLSPLFTSDKLKGLVPQMKKCYENTAKNINNNISNEIETSNFIDKYVRESISNNIFGNEGFADLSNDKSEFWKTTEKICDFKWKKSINFIIYFNFSKIIRCLKIPFLPVEPVNYLHKTVEAVFKVRSERGEKRNDIIQLLSQLKGEGTINVEKWIEEDDYLKISEQMPKIQPLEISNELLVNQSIGFLKTGFDTMSTSLIFTLIDLIQNPLIMKKLVDEIDNVYTQHKDFTYDALEDMKYLDMCLMESMRLHPVFPTIIRYCTRNHTFDNGIQIDKGTKIVIPTLAIHLNPMIYPEPTTFKPERFEKPPEPASFLPFGEGPKICIAKRFAMLEMKMMISQLLHNYKVKLSSSTPLPIKTEKWNIMSRHTSPVYFNFTKRVHSNVDITFN